MAQKLAFPLVVSVLLAAGQARAQLPPAEGAPLPGATVGVMQFQTPPEELPAPGSAQPPVEPLPSPSPFPQAQLPPTTEELPLPGSVAQPQSPFDEGTAPSDEGVVPAAAMPHKSPVPDDYLLYRKCASCCGPLGGDGPLRSEFYLQSGWSFPVGGSTLDKTLTTGWEIQAGGRLMIFDTDLYKAWYVDLSLSNIWNQGRASNIGIPFTSIGPGPFGTNQEFKFGVNGVPGVTVRNYNRTFASAAIGRDWYLLGPASAGCCTAGGCNWRVGFDVGGRYGTSRIQFHEIRQATGPVEGVFVGLHTDVEIPCGCCVFFGGIRGEVSQTWSHILQRQSDMQELQLLFTAGVRY